ncbi:MAG: response regulator transcription factor [Candidatus Kapabacteria bacterium]|nr:response regulator transcription factor [Candidatus Kapabacteria bacterium]
MATRNKHQPQIRELRKKIAELEHANEQLSRMLSLAYEHILRKREIILNTAEEVAHMQYETLKELYEHLALLPAGLRSQLRGLDDLNTFEQSLLHEHNQLKNILVQKHPQLSTTEMTICTYLCTNRSSKEIAGLMRLSVRTVEGHRKNIRTKLGLDPKENLIHYLQSLLH